VAQYLKTADSEWFRQRLTLVLICLFATFAALFLRLFQLQVLQGQELRRLSENNCIRLQSIDPSRGLIYDQTGKMVVDNRPSFNLSVVLKDARPVEPTLRRLARVMGMPSDTFVEKIKKDKNRVSYKPILLKQDIGRDALAAVEVHKYELPGIRVDVKPKRQYIARESAAHLLGYLSEISPNELSDEDCVGCRQGDLIGKFGVEKTYEKMLRGARGGRQVEVDARGRVVEVLKTVEAQPGFNLFLTIDQDLQSQAETLLKDTAGAVVAMDPISGQVLVMASSPSFDQNAFVDGMSHDYWEALRTNPFRPMENKVIQAEYPPASTYKIVTALAGLTEGTITESSTVFCPGHYQFGNRVYRCWKKGGHGRVDVVAALAESCDVFFYQVGQKLGVDRLAFYAKACGLGAPTGIELDHEAAGLIPTADWKKKRTGIPWQRGETLSIAIGQGYNLATPLQMVVLMAAVANDGIRLKPQIISRVETANGTVVEDHPPHVTGKIPFTARAMELVRKGLYNAVNSIRGTAKKIRLKNVDISGKTGTAQVFSRKSNEDNRKTPEQHHLKPHAWFVAYAPSDNPKIALAVIVEHGEHGSSAAAPIAGELIKTYLGAETPGEMKVDPVGQNQMNDDVPMNSEQSEASRLALKTVATRSSQPADRNPLPAIRQNKLADEPTTRN